MKTKTVLVLTSHYPPNIGGVESHLQALVSAIVKRGWRVVVSTYQPLAARRSGPIVEKDKSVLIYRVPWVGFNIVHKLTHLPLLEFLYLFPALFLSTLFVAFKHHKEIDVIHCQGLVPASIGMILKLIFRIRVISSIHNLYFFPKYGPYRWIAGKIFASSEFVLGPTEIARMELISIGVPSSSVKPFKYWLNLKHFSPTDKSVAKKRLGWKGFTVLFVGRLIKTKGVKEILLMAKDLNHEIKVVIVGDGPLKHEVEEAVRKYNNLIFLGRVENSQLPIYYSAADLLLVPSLVDEGWGFVAMEAISCGTPVLASQKGGLSDVVATKVGKLIKMTPANLRKWVEYYYSHQSELNRLTIRTRQYSLKNFGEESVELIIGAYEQ